MSKLYNVPKKILNASISSLYILFTFQFPAMMGWRKTAAFNWVDEDDVRSPPFWLLTEKAEAPPAARVARASDSFMVAERWWIIDEREEKLFLDGGGVGEWLVEGGSATWRHLLSLNHGRNCYIGMPGHKQIQMNELYECVPASVQCNGWVHCTSTR